MINFIEYPKCSTCKKAKKYLDELGIDHHDRHIVEERLSKEELTALYQKSGLPLKRFFNTSGLKYKELQLELLATDGMLVKRPIVETKDSVLVGFKANEYDNLK